MKNINSSETNLKNVTVTDNFIKGKMELIKNEVILYQWNALNDKIEDTEPSYCIRNFKLAKKAIESRKNNNEKTFPVDKWEYKKDECEKDSFLGWVFQDSDLYKWIEAVAYSVTLYPDEKLTNLAEYAIDLIADAQEDDGYIDTLYSINDISKRFSNLKDKHELYCFGHLAEAGVAYYNATGNRKLLNISCKEADLLCKTFGKGKLEGYPGHEIAEMALVKLYETTHKKEYLELAEFFISTRGTKPNFFSLQNGKEYTKNELIYNQAHIPVKEQKEAVGHAVRAVYLYSGMSDVAKYTNDEELLSACENLWDNITEKKMYITGGIGANANGEAFSANYDLPNDTAYAETCASIGLCFFAKRMMNIDANSKYADVIERCLYNGILSGISNDGKKFFYVNPLEVDPVAVKNEERKSHIKIQRQKWFGCACCPPNLARFISSLPTYASSETESTFYLHLYFSEIINSNKGKIKIISDIENSGILKIEIAPKSDFTFAVRIPSWSKNFSLSTKNAFIKNGYAYINITEKAEIEVQFDNDIKIVSTPKVKDNIGKVAITKCGTVYCLEEIDNGKELYLLKLADNPKFKYENGIITATGEKEIYKNTKLYEEYKKPYKKAVKLKFIPYRDWNNRGTGEMSVFIRN